MPELPEVETIRRFLVPDIVGKTFSKVEVLTNNMLHGNPKNLIGKKIIDVKRRGKVLAIELDDKSYLSFHFKLTGQLLYSSNMEDATFTNNIPLSQTNKMPGKSTRVIFYFSDGSGLFFNEMRMFGWVKYSKNIEGPKGIDIISSEFTGDYFRSTLAKTRREIKIILMDQDKFAGIGNIYANEALFEAKINPTIPANNLSIVECNRLYQSIVKIIASGIKYHGSSGQDEVYILPDGSKGEYQSHFTVYQRTGKPCKRCQSLIRRIKQGGRSSFYCPKCQDPGVGV